MGAYKYLGNLWRSEENKKLLHERMIRWRKEPVLVTLKKPTRLDRARALGYKAKKGFVLARVRVGRGGRKRELFKSGRRSGHRRRQKIVGKSYQWIAEERANKKFKNLSVLHSYYLAKDGMSYFYEIILVDPVIVSKYKGYEWLGKRKHRTRVYKGKTAAGKRSRGQLTHKGKGAEKLRPSLRAHKRRGK